MEKINLLNKIIGRFYFKRTQNHNLLGEFSNNVHPGNFTESADCIKITENFVGDYHATWQDNAVVIFAKLTINYKPNTRNTIFQLEWTSKNGEKMFEGEGFLFDNILIGDYRNFEII